MKLIFTLLGCICFFAFAKAQSPQPSSNQPSKLVADAFYGVDDFNNIYYGKENVFYRGTLESKSNVLQFYDVQLGDLTSVDLINPLKILLFYKDTQTVVLLDNRLNETQRFELDLLKPYRYFEFAGLAGERRLWLYNIDLQRLELYDYINDKLVVASPVIKDRVTKMLTDYNYSHLVTDRGVASYNNYASKTSELPLTNIQLADYDFEQLIIKQDSAYKKYRFTKDYQFVEVENDLEVDTQDPPKSLYLKNGKLYIYSRAGLSAYTTNQNKN
ncbi:hypothetical protein SAMN05192588_2000 [Nonlabens sp. Hel1_33_55]|uniref:hypothetical protein n=1 Tax=Nonlabens sp. Hel1_33_55 TaxID=1336802 RepID=UPI000875CB86|nr:hypothetical protein [Nonlabens sp. Hel1_33_55]SCY27572.1 hypothetical protein SAMN05192588_2000 [Nonlabens sp. Hel1_33_55]